jgi:hypothetical protein
MTDDSNSARKSKPDRQLVQKWMDGVSYALSHIPAGHQLDLAREIIETHYPWTPDLTFHADRGDIVLWASTQEARALAAILDEIITELGVRNIPEIECKRMMKVAWDRLDKTSREGFLKWAQREVSKDE